MKSITSITFIIILVWASKANLFDYTYNPGANIRNNDGPRGRNNEAENANYYPSFEEYKLKYRKFYPTPTI